MTGPFLWGCVSCIALSIALLCMLCNVHNRDEEYIRGFYEARQRVRSFGWDNFLTNAKAIMRVWIMGNGYMNTKSVNHF